MNLPGPIVEGNFLKRYKRFFADIDLNGQPVTAHVPNTGSLKSCLNPQSLSRLSYNDDPKRKLKYTLQMIKTPSSWVGVNTSLTNSLVWEAWEKKWIPHWKPFHCAKREVKISKETRFDMALWKNSTELPSESKITPKHLTQHTFHFVEVKNVTLAENGKAYFPDAVTTRGQKHLRELMKLQQEGHSCEIFFVIQRMDCNRFGPADNIDPEYGKLLRKAHQVGVLVSVYACELKKNKIVLNPDHKIKLEL